MAIIVSFSRFAHPYLISVFFSGKTFSLRFVREISVILKLPFILFLGSLTPSKYFFSYPFLAPLSPGGRGAGGEGEVA